jgi:hypothetical protein
MDPEVLKAMISAFKEVMLRAAGSKRQFSFFAWLLFIGLDKPNSETLLFTGGILLALWMLFIWFPSNDTNPVEPVA